MKIAIDYSWMGATGIGRVAREIIKRAPPEWTIRAVRAEEPNAAPLTPLALWHTLRSSDADVFWSPGFMPPVALGGKAVVLTIHDLTHLHYYGKVKRAYYDLLLKPLLARATHIVTVSDFTRAELLAWSGLPEDRVTMIPNAVGTEFSPHGARRSFDKKVILYVGNRRSYKNLPVLVRAFAASGLARTDHVLGLTGDRTTEMAALEARYGLAGKVKYFGFVPDEQLPTLYRSAHAVAFISMYEGFGLPILEAMASGVPVLTSTVSSMPEVAGDAAILATPHDVESVVAGLVEVAQNDARRVQLTTRGLRRAAAYSWDDSAAAYWRLFSRLSAGGERKWR